MNKQYNNLIGEWIPGDGIMGIKSAISDCRKFNGDGCFLYDVFSRSVCFLDGDKYRKVKVKQDYLGFPCIDRIDLQFYCGCYGPKYYSDEFMCHGVNVIKASPNCTMKELRDMCESFEVETKKRMDEDSRRSLAYYYQTGKLS